MLRFIARLLIFVIFVEDVAFAAVRSSTVDVMGGGTKVSEQVVYKPVSDQCETQFFGCMDNFCLVDNEMGGRCVCTADAEKYAAETTQLKDDMVRLSLDTADKLSRLATGISDQIERVQTEQKPKLVWPSIYDDDEEDDDLIINKKGRARYAAALEFCHERLDSECAASSDMLDALYSKTMRSDCVAWANAIKELRNELTTARVTSASDVLKAGVDAYRKSNKYDISQCVVAYQECFMQDTVCGADWGQCIDIDADVMDDILMAKRPICDGILDECDSVREQVWPSFRELVKKDLMIARLHKEADVRQTCKNEVESCLENACRDDIAGKGIASMDACLSRPEMVRSFCKVELDRCEPLVPDLWDLQEAKLMAKVADACATELHDCYAHESACGPDMLACIGLDKEALRKICPKEKLVVCRETNPSFDDDDLDTAIRNVFNGIDFALAEACDQFAADKMIDVCGDTLSCDIFAGRDYVGANSLTYQNNGTLHVLSGLLDFNLIKISDGAKHNECVRTKGENCDQYPRVGTIDIDGYLDKITENTQNTYGMDYGAIMDKIEQELRLIQAQADGVISVYLSDPNVDMCMNGRDLKNITGQDKRTPGRYYKVADEYLAIITSAALIQAQNNYNARMTQLVQEATKNMKEQNKAASCYDLPLLLEGQDPSVDQQDLRTKASKSTDIAKVIGRSISSADLAKIGSRKTDVVKDDILTRTVWSTWDPNTRKCHIFGIDKYCGKESIVNQIMKMNERSYDPDTKNAVLTNAAVTAGVGAGVGVATAATIGAVTAETAITGVTAALGATTAIAASVPVIGWAVAAATALAMVFTFAFRKKPDPYICREREWDTETQLN